MILRLRRNLDDARLALVMSVADTYYEPVVEEDQAILAELILQYPEEGAVMKELMPAWKRWGYEEGIEEGIEKGIEKGIDITKQHIALKLLQKGVPPEEVADTIDWSVETVKKLMP